LTLIMHVIFFTVLYFGVNWRAQQPEGMEVTLWANLPETDNHLAPSTQPAVAKPAPPQKVEPTKPNEAEKPALPAKADIELAEKKKKPMVKSKEDVKLGPKKGLSKAEHQRALAEIEAQGNQLELAEQRDMANRAAQAAAESAGISSEKEKFIGLIRSRIRRNIGPSDVADDALAVFVVTLLTDGSVLDVKLRKSSGNAAYDSAVERAIWKAQPLPLPQDEAARNLFINPKQLLLKFSPKEKE